MSFILLLTLAAASPPPWTSPNSPLLSAQPPAPRAEKPRPVSVTIAVGRGAYQLYRLTLSDAKGSNCHFNPSCSRYGMDAIEKYDLPLGLVLFAARLMKNHADLSGFYRLEPGGTLADPLQQNVLWLESPKEFRWEDALATYWSRSR